MISDEIDALFGLAALDRDAGDARGDIDEAHLVGAGFARSFRI